MANTDSCSPVKKLIGHHYLLLHVHWMKICNYNQIDVQAKFEYSFYFIMVSLTGVCIIIMCLDRMSMLTVMVVSRQFLKIHMLLQLYFASLCSIALCFVITLLFASVTKKNACSLFAKPICCCILVFGVAMAIYCMPCYAHK